MNFGEKSATPVDSMDADHLLILGEYPFHTHSMA
jgi:hypothetical protein